MMEDYVEVFRDLQSREVVKVLSALQEEGISCYMEAGGPWGRAPVANPDDCLSSPANSYFVMVRRDQFQQAQELVSKYLHEGIPSDSRIADRPRIRTRTVHKIGALLGGIFILLLIFLTIWNFLGK